MRGAERLRTARWILALAGSALVCGHAQAHSLSPSLLLVQERAPGVAAVTWKNPVMQLPGAALVPVLPAACKTTVPPTRTEDEESVTTRWEVDCAPLALAGQRIGVEGLGTARTDALLHVELADGRSVDTVLRARAPSFTVPDRDRPFEVAQRYAVLGFEHIMTGFDHLLFVFGLLLLVSGARPLLATVTAFTLGHSVTLTLAVLDVARVPSAPVEALIALSIFALAVELARPAAATLMRRRPWAMAAVFGLLHGLGFAGALREVGLPSEAIPLALLAFNVGIELGQIAFVLAIVSVGAALRFVVLSPPAWARLAPVYGIGSLAALWTIDRILPLLR
jgi:hydrogenase/urease accessory protein HupE